MAEEKKELVVYKNKEGTIRLDINLQEGSIWLTRKQIAELFGVEKQNIDYHITNIFETQELPASSTAKEILVVQKEGERDVQRNLEHYNLDMILSIGYRVNSLIATRFRQWASQILKEFMIKGFAMDDERLKNPQKWDYFDELLERIREIRASEKRFYQKIRDVFKLSVDYDDDTHKTNLFFAIVQNKLLYAVTGNVAAQIIVNRANADSPNMNLTTWKGSRVRKEDVTVAKNYLTQAEVKKLDRMVSMFLDYVEDIIERKQQLFMKDWVSKTNKFLEFYEYEITEGSGGHSKKDADKLAHKRYEEFNEKRKKQEAIDADEQDLIELKSIEAEVKKKLEGQE